MRFLTRILAVPAALVAVLLLAAGDAEARCGGRRGGCGLRQRAARHHVVWQQPIAAYGGCATCQAR